MNLICYISPNDNGTAIIDKVTNTELSLGGGDNFTSIYNDRTI